MASVLPFDDRSRAFFSSAADFNPGLTSNAWAEFSRLAHSRNWKHGGETFRQNWRECFGVMYDREQYDIFNATTAASTHTSNARSHDFFAAAANFTPDFSATPLSEFSRLGRTRGWKFGGKAFRKNWLQCFGITFNSNFDHGSVTPPAPVIALAVTKAPALVKASAPKTKSAPEKVPGPTETPALQKAHAAAKAQASTNKAAPTKKADPEKALAPTKKAAPKKAPSPVTIQSNEGVLIAPFASARGDGVNDFFERYRSQNFDPNYQSPLKDEFQRLAESQGWHKGTGKYREYRSEAFQEEIRGYFDDDAERVLSWQLLCYDVGVTPIPPSITQCRKALDQEKVNLIDVMDHRRTGAAIKVFKSKVALERYTKKGRVFPLDAAKAGGIFRALLEDFRYGT